MIILIIPIVIIVLEGSSFAVHGWFIAERDLDLYFAETFNQYKETANKDGWFYGLSQKPFIARDYSLLARWYISDYGRIPIWSKWSKKLDEIRIIRSHSLLDLLEKLEKNGN